MQSPHPDVTAHQRKQRTPAGTGLPAAVAQNNVRHGKPGETPLEFDERDESHLIRGYD